MNLHDCESLECLQRGLHLKLSYYEFPIYITQVSDPETDTVKLMGVFPELVVPFALGSLNITYEFILSDVLPYGVPKINGTWPGDLGMLQNDISDINVGAHTVDYEKFSYFCPFTFVQRHSVTFLASVGKQDQFDFFCFLYLIDNRIWIFFFLSMAVIAILSSFSDMLKTGSLTYLKMQENIIRCFWMLLASIFCEGSPRTMSSRCGQMLHFLWLFVILVLVNVTYSQFKGILMIRYDGSYFRTIEDLSKKPEILPLIVPNTVLEESLRDSLLEAYQKVYQNAVRHKEETYIEQSQHMDSDIYQLVKDGTHVLSTSVFFCKVMLKHICPALVGNRKFYFVDEEVGTIDTVFLTSWRISFFLRKKIDQRLHWMREGGLLDQWLLQYYRGFETCQEFSQEDDLLLQLKHMKAVFYLYLSLNLFATVIFVIEIIPRITCCISSKPMVHAEIFTIVSKSECVF